MMLDVTLAKIMALNNTPFWKSKTLEQMNDSEWESLCDGCGQCCLIRLQDDETEEIFTTNVSCKLLNNECCRCRDYVNRKKRVPECLTLRPLTDSLVSLLPKTCAYRLLSIGEELQQWHPLISGDKNTVIKAGISIAGRAISELDINHHDLEDYIID